MIACEIDVSRYLPQAMTPVLANERIAERHLQRSATDLQSLDAAHSKRSRPDRRSAGLRLLPLAICERRSSGSKINSAHS
jgi:hypothetical protein